jgi:ribonuclease BN (tRNA processing enzyme)
MRLRVLGCHGGETPSHRPASFLVDDKLLLDAGSVTRSLALGEQARVDFVFISHSHMDHVKDLPLLLENVIGRREGPVTLVASPGTAEILERHLFNGLLWPDFTKVPSAENPVLQVQLAPAGAEVVLDGLELTLVPVDHTVEAHAVLVTGKSGTLAYTGDTGPTDALWRALGEVPRLRAIVCEVSFPDELEELAHVTKHLTPKLLAAELEKLPASLTVPVLVAHVKPGHEEPVRAQLAALGDPRVRMLRLLEEIEL